MQLKPGHIEIRLETRSGDFVSYAQVPPMQPSPEVVAWGERLFILSALSRLDGRGNLLRLPVYEEGIAWVVQDPTPYDEAALPPDPVVILAR